VTSATNELNRMGRRSILAVDYGRARIGLAIADSEARMAQPLSTMERVNRNEDMRRLRELVREQGVKQIVVGLPLRLDGTRGSMAEEAERFAQRVRKQIGVPVEMVDERLTSWEAERLLETDRQQNTEECAGQDDRGRRGGCRDFEGVPGSSGANGRIGLSRLRK
jgi:putative Holliday junction resolvase